MKHSHLFNKLLCFFLIANILCICAYASDIRVKAHESYALSCADFDETADGIYIASVPSDGLCKLKYGTRVLCAGDVLSKDALQQLEIAPVCDVKTDCSIRFFPITDGKVCSAKTLSFSLIGSKNTAPSVCDSSFETYKNIAHEGKLEASDPEADEISFQLYKAPKRGSVTLHEDGTFEYTPKHNKVGKDSFQFTATDANGAVSEPATVSVRIVRPTDVATYADLAGADGEYEAMWLKEVGAFSGERIGSQLVFHSDKPVSRGEFLVMAMKVFSQEAEQTALTSNFADEILTPEWMKPYIVSAFSSGMISGSLGQDGLLFRPSSAVTTSEAAVMVQNFLKLPEAVNVFSSEEADIPAWARGAVSALAENGILLCADRELTRMDAAKLLYNASQLYEE